MQSVAWLETMVTSHGSAVGMYASPEDLYASPDYAPNRSTIHTYGGTVCKTVPLAPPPLDDTHMSTVNARRILARI